MSVDRIGGIVAVGLMLVLVGSGLVARRAAWPKLATMTLVWTAIFLAATVLAKLLGRL